MLPSARFTIRQSMAFGRWLKRMREAAPGDGVRGCDGCAALKSFAPKSTMNRGFSARPQPVPTWKGRHWAAAGSAMLTPAAATRSKIARLNMAVSLHALREPHNSSIAVTVA